MSVTTGLFYAFSTVLLLAAFRVITARNPVHSALFLVLAFFQAALIWMLLKAEFLSITLVLVYVGAVMVLFLFVVMMMDINVENLRVGFWRHFPLAAAVGVLIALEMAAVLMGGFRMAAGANRTGCGDQSPSNNTLELGKLIYTQYILPLEVAAAILLVAMIAAIASDPACAKGQQVRASPVIKCVSRPRTVWWWCAWMQHALQPEEPSAAAPCGETSMTLTLGHFLSLGAMLFALSVVGIFLNRRNLIVLLMAIELMLLAVNTNFVAFSYFLNDLQGKSLSSSS